ncbi:MAG: lipoyl(octanoyl) transferase LipB [Cytophagaceae bacterium]|nr:lipoyl(octanoyl) transferase LipB [Cytophagaceae bacterium]MDW8455182.1 lipoyl(octanoyl) transferase LipB [Cytophagaceae bacterium]
MIKEQTIKTNKNVEVINLGLIGYIEALRIQEELFNTIIRIKTESRNKAEKTLTQNYLLYCSHPPVFTLGRSGKKKHLLVSEFFLKENGLSFYETTRGGDITFHGPGQLVVYPILDLDNFFTDIHLYMRTLEQVVIEALAEFGISSGRVEGLTGVWVNYENPLHARKICAMGVKTSRWVTMHGLALNINTDLSYFNYIVPCGIENKSVTSMQKELRAKVDEQKVSEIVLKKIEKLFQMQLVRSDLNKITKTSI